MDADRNRETMRAIYRDAARGDLGFVDALLSPDFVVTEADGLPYGGSYSGPQGLVQVFGRIAQAWDPFRFDPISFVADGDLVVVILNATGASRKTGKPFSMQLAEVWRFADGKIVELRPFYWDTHALHLLNS